MPNKSHKQNSAVYGKHSVFMIKIDHFVKQNHEVRSLRLLSSFKGITFILSGSVRQYIGLQFRQKTFLYF